MTLFPLWRMTALVSACFALSILGACGGSDNDSNNNSTGTSSTGDPSGNAQLALAKALMPDYPDVVGEYVQLDGGAQVTASNVVQTPAEFNKVTFLRVRSALDGENPKPANAVILAMPGFSSTPGHWMYLASQLVHKANLKKGGCKADDAAVDCRIEIWIVQRRGAHLADTTGARNAIASDDPSRAVSYYFGSSILGSDGRFALDGRGKFPAATPKSLTGRADASWKPLQQGDLPFMADWGYEAYARDLEKMLTLVKQQSGSKNVFLAGHSQGGSFTSIYAASLRPDNSRGQDKLAGIVMLDGGGYGTVGAPSAAQISTLQTAIDGLRAGSRPVYTDATGANLASGPAVGARDIASTRYYAKEDPSTESLFAPRQTGMIVSGTAFPGTSANSANAFLGTIRLNHLARAGMNFDTSPTVTAAAPFKPLNVNLQEPLVIALGESLGLLDFTPLAGKEADCDSASPAGKCVPLPSQIDPAKVYGWKDAGGSSAIPVADKVGVGKAMQFMKGYAWTTNRTNIKPLSYQFPASGARTVDAREVVTTNWYPSERYEADMSFAGAGPTYTFDYKGVNFNVDKSLVTVPLYYAHQGPASTSAPSVFPQVSDYTNIGSTGTLQSAAAAAKSPIATSISSRYYKHTDFVSADDSLGDSASRPAPGDPGSSLVANTLVDWIIARTGSKPATVPTPADLGVVLSR
jgi:pimeloyl-ACP methyl ester carboxylesterase